MTSNTSNKFKYSHIFDTENSTGDFTDKELQKYIDACLIDIEMDDEMNEWPFVEFKFGHHIIVGDDKITLTMPCVMIDPDYEGVVLRFKKL